MLRPTIETVCYSPFVCAEYYVPSRPTKSPSVGVGEFLYPSTVCSSFNSPRGYLKIISLYKKNKYFKYIKPLWRAGGNSLLSI